ncbi:MAG: RNA-binding protein [Desulfobacterales bacterium]|nr:RNA-binding protein [Desulfobacterales bacterium]
MNIYVGNLSYDTSESDLQAAFEAFGHVDTVRVINDRDTGRSKGFGFVEMSSDAEGRSAIEGLNDTELKGRSIKVNEARPKAEGDRGGGGRGPSRGRSGGSGGGRGPGGGRGSGGGGGYGGGGRQRQ